MATPSCVATAAVTSRIRRGSGSAFGISQTVESGVARVQSGAQCVEGPCPRDPLLLESHAMTPRSGSKVIQHGLLPRCQMGDGADVRYRLTYPERPVVQ